MCSRGILTIFIAICSVLCYAKRNFDIIIERVELSDVDPEMIIISCTVNKYNRTTKALSLNWTLLKNHDTSAAVEIQGYAMFGNEYKPVPIRFRRNICDIFKNEFLWVKSQVVKHSHFPTQCPVLVGDYYLKDFVPNGADFPAAANIPWTKVMARLRFLYRDKVYTQTKVYVTFDHDAELKSQG